MQLPVQQFPILTAGQMSPFHQAIQTGIENYMNTAKAAYEPMKLLADAESKAAYATLMGPQYMAKLYGNKDVVSNLPNPQAGLDYITSPVRGQGIGTTNNSGAQPSASSSPPTQSWAQGLMQHIGEKAKALFGDNQAPQNQQQTQAPQQDNTQSNNAGNVTNQDDELGQAMDAWTQKHDLAKDAYPPKEQLINWYRSQNPQLRAQSGAQQPVTQQAPVQQQTAPQDNNDQNAKQTEWSENVARNAGIVKEGEKLGEARGTAIDRLGEEYKQDTSLMGPLTHLGDLTQNPVFINMRNKVPFFQDKQLDVLKSVGTPEEQKLLGDFITTTKNVVADTVNSFKGRAMSKEFDFANTMKVSEKDTMAVALGKIEALRTYKQAEMERNNIARNLMEGHNADHKHYNEGDAYNIANQQVDMNKIRSQIADKYPLPVSITNKKTNEKRVVTLKEYNRMMGLNSNTPRPGG